MILFRNKLIFGDTPSVACLLAVTFIQYVQDFLFEINTLLFLLLLFKASNKFFEVSVRKSFSAVCENKCVTHSKIKIYLFIELLEFFLFLLKFFHLLSHFLNKLKLRRLFLNKLLFQLLIFLLNIMKKFTI